MSKSINQKSKLLYVRQFLLENTDENNHMTTSEIIKELESRQISAERKSIYNDIITLRDFGMDIETSKGKTASYRVLSREFELAEIKILVDLVQSSKFITSKKSASLIKKLETLTSKHEGSLLQRKVFLQQRVKSDNETIYYSVDKIHEAVSLKQFIRFQYTEWTMDLKLKERKNGEYYEIFPLGVNWDNENYYFIGYDCKENKRKHFRVDKIKSIEIVYDEVPSSELMEMLDDFQIKDYQIKTFSMFGGAKERVTLEFENDLIGVIIDRFGKDADISEVGDNKGVITEEIHISNQFFGWISGLGKKAKILHPENVAQKYKSYILSIASQYE